MELIKLVGETFRAVVSAAARPGWGSWPFRVDKGEEAFKTSAELREKEQHFQRIQAMEPEGGQHLPVFSCYHKLVGT